MSNSIENICSQLTGTYLSAEEFWHIKKLSPDESNLYHKTMIERGNLIYEADNFGKLLGYCEFLRVNFEQWGRMVCHAPFYNFDENTTDGNISYVSNVWIHPEYRRSFVLQRLKKRYYELNNHCEFYVGEALRKKTQLIKVFKKSELRSKMFTGELARIGV